MPAPTAAPLVTGAEYVRQLTARDSDRLARSAFRDLVLKIAPPEAALFEFGSGTGMDARFYAERGFTVAAYDVDPQMCDFFADYCRELIESGRVTLARGSYHQFLAGHVAIGDHAIDLVTSNFAPLNLIADLRELFAKFHALTGPHGRVLASVLSPYYLGDVKYGWWWRNAWRLWRRGWFAVRGAQASIVRRSLSDFARQSAPYFALRGVFPGARARADAFAGAPGTWLRLSTNRFMFLLFEKLPQAGDLRH